MTSVINLRHEPRLREQFDHVQVVNSTVLIDRRTKWGNRFRIGRDGNRQQVVALYRADLWRRIRAGEISLEELAELESCWLACHCDPLPCHGHVLERAAVWAARVLRSGPRRDAPPLAARSASLLRTPPHAAPVAGERE